MFVVDDYITLVSSNLAEKDDLLLSYLHKVRELEISPNVKNLLFTLYIEPSRFELTFVLFAYDNHANEVMGLSEGGNFFSSVSSPEIPYLSLSNSEFKEYEAFYEEHEWETDTKQQEVFFNWFLSNWKVGEQGQHPMPVYLQIHDEERTLDLKQEKWISSEKIWKQ
ncbi:hypothetical protein HNQ44_003025 [Planomicrobium koreense]|uniref:Uncharacterized protein n=1 Tax=Planococcus koreensis TaxID=112331 RepID=A0A7W8CU23_9BACL|nr:hypothetical protein [Planococcus koreensis]MBB5181560.1 hypothetical protein [Planococcus koreensis]